MPPVYAGIAMKDAADKEALQQVIDALDGLAPRIPVEVDLWSTREIAAYLKRSERTIRDGVVVLPGFPPAIRLPAVGSHDTSRPPRQRISRGRPSAARTGLGQPLWKAREVIAWAERHQERRAG